MSDHRLFKKIYQLLDQHPLALVDCGELCGKTCCCYQFPDLEDGMELIPGEELVFPLDASWQQNRVLSSEEYDYPTEWGSEAGCVQIRCNAPCIRDQRPVNCRLFPFQICSIDGHYYLVLSSSGLDYPCPLVLRPELINQNYIESAKKAANLLLTIPRFKQLVDWDSEEIKPTEIIIKYAL